jgi:hypothetical protein
MPFGLSPSGDMFQKKIDDMFRHEKHAFGIADDILIVGFKEDGSDHDAAVRRVLKICKKENLRLNPKKCHFRCSMMPFFGELLSRHGVKPYPEKVNAIHDLPAPKDRKELMSIIGSLSYVGHFSPRTAMVLEPLRKLTSVKNDFT